VSDRTVAQLLDESRRELLDLSGRNRLLSVPIESSSARLIHAVGEESDVLMRLLVTEGRSLSFLATKAGRGDRQSAVEADVGESEIDLGGETLSANGQSTADDPDEDVSGVETLDPELASAPGAGEELVRDTRITTGLTAEGLQKRLLNLYRDAQTIMEEQGFNILYVALGRLKWFEAESSDTPRYAPLLLVPVELARKSAGSRFLLKWRGEDVETNLSLAAKLKQDFDIQLPEVSGDEDFVPSRYFAEVAAAIHGAPRWAVEPNGITLGFFSFAKFLMYRDLDPRNWPDPTKFVEGSALSSLLGSAGFGTADRPFPEETDIDGLIPAAKLDHVVDADGSQTLAIESIRGGRSLVIQGPPGTGKSQTITNVIATAVLAGKRVLFVAEKLAALEVVKRRLEAAGLGAMCLELHSHKANKRAVLEELKRTWELGRPRGEEMESMVGRLEALRGKLNDHAKTLHEPIPPYGASFFQIIGALAMLSARGQVAAACSLPGAAEWQGGGMSDRRDRVNDLAARAETLGPPGAHPWRGSERENVSSLDYAEIRAALDAGAAALASLAPELARAADALRQPLPKDFTHAEALRRLAAHVASAPRVDRDAICHHVWSAALDSLRALVERGRSFAKARAGLESRVVDAAFGIDLSAARAVVATHGQSWLRFLRGDFRKAMADLRGVLRSAPPKAYAERVALLDELTAAQGHFAAIRSNDELGRQAFGHAWRGKDSDWEELDVVVSWVAGEAEARLGPDFRRLFVGLDGTADFVALSESLTTRMQEAWRAAKAIASVVSLNPQVAFGAAGLDRVPLDALTQRVERWRASVEDISRWSAWFVRTKEARGLGLGPLVDAIESGAIAPRDTRDAFERAFYTELARDAMRKRPELARFDGAEHDRIVEDFRRADRDRLTLAKYRVLARHYDTLPARHANMGMTGVLLGEFERKRGHRPIRKLLRDAGSVVQSIKPVFMMSPLSVAQFLQPGAIDFDLLVIDEASQIPPVDAFGAFARARQHVVVGDSKQLPPTRFFARLTGNDESAVEEDEEVPQAAQAREMESILGLCVARGLPQSMLRWHYRSRHQSLIAVSNREFYEDKLFIVPSPHRAGEALGLAFRHVADGAYDRGGSGTNRAEAVAVCDAIVEHARSSPNRSLGVAAFSIKQKQAILDELELRRQRHPELEEFLRQHPYEPFFVKNLESVQGDERDIIFISVGYGRDASGYMTMNFGPLSADGGERRLNVLISRAKRQCVVFSSIRAGDIDLARASGRGVRSFKTFLEFAETGRLGIAERSGREEDSPFEEAVRRAVETLGPGYEVVPQVGQSGFFVDLGVIDKEMPGRYLLGIECDGAAYHSSRSARDRDRLRQAVLEDHGWRIHRVWSTDWFQRSESELKKIADALADAKRDLAEADAPEPRPTLRPGPAQAPPPVAIARDEDDASIETVASLAEPYVETQLTLKNAGAIHEVPANKMAEVVLRVIQREGPIVESEVIARVRSFWGLERAGARVQEAVQRGIAALVESGRCERVEDALAVPGVPIGVRDRSKVSSPGLRKPDALPKVELRAAIETALDAMHAASEADTIVAVARAIGFKATSGILRERIAAEIRWLAEQGRVTVEGGLCRRRA
jgi:very-short-patch-repair endonuclease